MKYIIYTDRQGFKRRALVRDNDTLAEAEYGIPAGPPDVRLLDWEGMAKEVNNELAENGLYTWDDVIHFSAGLSIALTIFKRRLVALYRQDENEEKLHDNS